MRNWRPCGRREGPEQNAIEAKQKELNALRDQMQEKMTAYRLEAKKIAPDFDMGMGVGMGMGMGPGGMGMGPVAWAWAPVLDRRRRLPPAASASAPPAK